MAAFTFTLGKKYSSIADVKKDIKKYNVENFVKLVVDDSCTKKTAAKRGCAKPITDEVGYNFIQYVCHYSGKFKSQKSKDVRETTTCKIECEFKLRFLATEDGKELEIIVFHPVHKNHSNTEQEFNLLPSQRKVDNTTEKEMANKLMGGMNRKTVQHEYSERTGKPILMKDVHNIATKARKIFAQDIQMKDILKKYPETLLV